MTEYGFIHALQIDSMITLVNRNYRGYTELHLKDYFSTDPEVLRYRLEVVEDLVENEAVYQMFQQSIDTIMNISDLRRAMANGFTKESALSCVRFLETYQEIVGMFASVLRKAEIHSAGLRDFRREILEIADGGDYKNLCSDLKKMETNFGYIRSITLGVNLDENLRPKTAGILNINREEYRSGTVMDRLLRRSTDQGQTLMAELYPLEKGLHGEELKAFNYALQTAMYTVFEKSLRHFEPVVQRYFNMNTAVFLELLDDIRFLTAGVRFIRDMVDHGFSMCRPKVYSMEERICRFKGIYNPGLARKMIEKNIISNDFCFDEKGRFFLVTGPNHGGKSIFLYSVGMAQALMQLGLFVPAEEAEMSPVSDIYTHFPSSDENNYGKGRLESECARLGEIMHRLKATDLLLMDESLSSTSGIEAECIASEILTGIGLIGCSGIYVTHIHALTERTAEFNAYPGNRSKFDNLVAVMENKEDGVRSFRVMRTKPDGMSYARDIARRYGLDLQEILTERRESGIQ